MKTIGRLSLCWIASAVSFLMAGVIIRLLQLHPLQAPGNPSLRTTLLLTGLSLAVLVVGLFPLARGLAGSAGQRVAAFIAFLALASGVNTMIEASFFTNVIDHAHPAIAVVYASEALLVGLALGFLFGRHEPAQGLAHHGWPGFAARTLAAWLSFPIVYFLFGMSIAPIVIPYYRGGIAGLRIPPNLIIFEVQLVRSVLFLVASLPLIALWKGSRKALWLCLGLAHATVVGLCPLVASNYLPPVLRLTHGVEIMADSFAYAAVLVWLFAAHPSAANQHPTGQPDKNIAVLA